jgi:pyruvate dehydrogenase E1 component alpha subunit
VDEWLARDPLPSYRARLESIGVGVDVLDAIDARARADVDKATEEAKAGAMPGEELLLTDVWADGGSSWRN